MATITAANSVFLISVVGLYDTSQQLQGYGVDDAFSAESVDNTEAQKGVDGLASFGWIPNFKPLEIMLQANSPSIAIFEQVWSSEEQVQEKYIINGSITYPGIGKRFILTNGVMKGFTPFAAAKKVLAPQRFQLLFDQIQPQPI